MQKAYYLGILYALLPTSLTESNRVVFAGGRHDLSRVKWFWLAEDGSRVSAGDG